MCVIVSQPKGAHLKKDRAERLWEINSHGGGFAYIDKNDKLKVVKTMEFQSFWSQFERARSANPKAHFLLHMRIATHGTVDTSNVHPFRVDKHTVMAHNGIIKGVDVDPQGNRSDTRVFVEDLLPTLPETWLDNPYLVDMVETWIGWSKLMFLTTNPKLKKSVYILNEDSGHDKDGMWFSNTHGVDEPRPTPIYKGGKVYQRSYVETSSDWIGKGKKPTKRKSMMGPIEVRNKLHKLREKAGNTTPITFNYESRQKNSKLAPWECLGCQTAVDVNTGECECWATFCLECSQLTAVCLCEDGFSGETIHWSKMTDESILAMMKRGEEYEAKWEERNRQTALVTTRWEDWDW